MFTTGDDKIWDYLSKGGPQTLEGYRYNVPSAVYQQMLPIIVIVAEGTAGIGNQCLLRDAQSGKVGSVV